MEKLLHAATSDHRPDGTGRFSTVGHAEAFRAFARAAKRAGVRFMLIGGAFRDVAVRASSTRDLDVVLIDRAELDEAAMRAAGFERSPRSKHLWRYRTKTGRTVDLEVAAVASSTADEGPFSVAVRHATTRRVEGIDVPVPTVEDYVILKLIAAAADRRRSARDLVDVRSVFEAYPERLETTLSVPAIRARLRDEYGTRGRALTDLVAVYRRLPR